SNGQLLKQSRGLMTTTVDFLRSTDGEIDEKTKRFVGLHVDDWSKEGLGDRVEAQNRIMVNVGLEARYFLFLPISIGRLVESLGDDEIMPGIGGTGVSRRYLSLHPELPIWRLRIELKEAYIAPTENIVHDGSTVDCNAPSFCVVYRGYFNST